MKRVIVLIAVLFLYVGAVLSQNTTEDAVYSVLDSEYEWSLVSNKYKKVMVKDGGLMLISKGGMTNSVVELPINVAEDDFTFGVSLNVFSKVCDVTKTLSSKKFYKLFNGTQNLAVLGISSSLNGLGIIFDYVDANNYKGLIIFQKHWECFNVRNGMISPVRSGMLKHTGKSYNISVARKAGVTSFMLDDFELIKLRNLTFQSPCFGVFISGTGMKAIMPNFTFTSEVPGDSEESTTGN